MVTLAPPELRRQLSSAISTAPQAGDRDSIDTSGRPVTNSGLQELENRVFCASNGGKWWVDQYGRAFRQALKAAGVSKRPRRLHDARHGALTAMAQNSAAAVAIQHVARHSSMQTTRKYIHLAGTAFPEEAAKLQARLLSTRLSTDPASPEVTSGDLNGLTEPHRGQ